MTDVSVPVAVNVLNVVLDFGDGGFPVGRLARRDGKIFLNMTEIL